MITVALTQIPESGQCVRCDGEYHKICPYYSNEGGHMICELWDFLGVDYKQERTPQGVVNTVCSWQKKVIV